MEYVVVEPLAPNVREGALLPPIRGNIWTSRCHKGEYPLSAAVAAESSQELDSSGTKLLAIHAGRLDPG